MTVRITLKETLEATGGRLTRNAIAVHAKVRPATLHDMVNGKTKSISYETLDAILNAMNELDETRSYDISDIIRYKNKEKSGE